LVDRPSPKDPLTFKEYTTITAFFSVILRASAPCLPAGRRRIPCQLISDYHCCGWDSSLTLRMTAGTNCCKWDSCLSAGRLQSLLAVGGPAYRQAGLPTDRRAPRMTSVRASF